MKPVIVLTPVDNGYILEAHHPETGLIVGTRIATTTASSYDSNSLNTGVDKLLEIDCKSAEAPMDLPKLHDEVELFEVAGDIQTL